MSAITLQAPAKINLFLHVLGKRPDGYHEIDTLLAPIELFDTIRIRVKPARAIDILLDCTSRPDLAGPANLAHRAAEKFLEAAGRTAKVWIEIDKRIPIQAGLGGGSSDAGTTLVGLNQLMTPSLPLPELRRIAMQLGADVPFFTQRGPCRARGIGEILTPADGLPPFWVLLAVAPFGLATRMVYEELNLPLTSNGNNGTESGPVSARGADDIAALLRNDLQPTGERLRPVIRSVREELERAGALGAQMSGSGPSVFGLFGSREDAQTAKGRIEQTRQDWKYLVARGITSATGHCATV